MATLTGRHPLSGRLPARLAFKPGLARRKIAGLNPLSTGTCGCVTAEVDYQVRLREGEPRGRRWAASANRAAGLSRDAGLSSPWLQETARHPSRMTGAGHKAISRGGRRRGLRAVGLACLTGAPAPAPSMPQVGGADEIARCGNEQR